MIEFEYRGGHYRLYLNGEALFNAYTKFGRDKNLIDVINAEGKEGFESSVWLLCELSHQGELYARFLGEERGQVLEYTKTVIQIQPYEIPEIKKVLMEAITEGFFRDHPDKELEEDLFLQEFEAQKKTKSRKHNIFGRLLKG